MPDQRPHYGVIDKRALPRLSVLPPQDQFRAVFSEFIRVSPLNHRALRIAAADWMRSALSLVDELPPPTPADMAESLRCYAKQYYHTNRERILASRRERYRQRQRREFGI